MADVLAAYVNFDAEVLRERLAGQLAESGLPQEEQAQFLDDLSAGLQGYTYLE